MNLSYEQYMYLFYGGLILACGFLILAIILFLLLRIPQIIGILSGTAERKEIELIRSQSNTDKNYGDNNLSRVKLTQKMNANESTNDLNVTDKIPPKVSTALLDNGTQVLSNQNSDGFETQILMDENNSCETQVLSDNTPAEKGTVMADDVEYTGQTTVLGNEENVLIKSDINQFVVRTQIILFESKEIIA